MARRWLDESLLNPADRQACTRCSSKMVSITLTPDAVPGMQRSCEGRGSEVGGLSHFSSLPSLSFRFLHMISSPSATYVLGVT